MGFYWNNLTAMQPVRVIFMGTVDIACPSLALLYASPGVSVVAVVTQPEVLRPACGPSPGSRLDATSART